ncbi:transcriptional regulator FnrL [Paracoccus sp. Z118]|uniref:transcriptional regulator FnrL n=1 Tax=Paracoccus sp. Z118 TaxID=2851017 RepID=UPI0020B6EA6F|nr:Crp/Fnr family transcriptional regulator [Paracoccus sp. Z118]
MTQINQDFTSAAFRADHSCADCRLRPRAVCSLCDVDDMRRLEPLKYYRRYQAGQVIAWAGDRMEFVGTVVDGVAAMTQTMEDGRTQMVGLLLPSDFLGRPRRQTAAYTVTAVTDLLLCCYRRRTFEDLLLSTPALSSRLLEITMDELDAAREWMLLLGRKTAREKIASLLAILARRGGARGPDGQARIVLPLSREAMADYLGLTLETVSRQMSALRRDGIIVLEGARHVIVPDCAALVAESGGDGAETAPAG